MFKLWLILSPAKMKDKNAIPGHIDLILPFLANLHYLPWDCHILIYSVLAKISYFIRDAIKKLLL